MATNAAGLNATTAINPLAGRPSLPRPAKRRFASRVASVPYVGANEKDKAPETIPSKGDRVEETRQGIRRLGTVWYADQLQVLVKWDDGSSSSLPLGRSVPPRRV
jgi:hypothetical protein